MTRFVKIFVLLLSFFASGVLSAMVTFSSGSGSVSRGVNVSKFNITLILAGLQVPGTDQLSGSEPGYYSRLNIYIAQDSSNSLPLPWTDEGQSGSLYNQNFSISNAVPENPVQQSDGTTTVTFSFLITCNACTSNPSYLSTLMTSNTSGITVNVYYLQGQSTSPQVYPITVTRASNIANQPVTGISVTGSFHAILVGWTPQTTITYNPSGSTAPQGVNIYIVDQVAVGGPNGQIGLAGLLFQPSQQTDTQAETCMLNTKAGNGNNCVTCPANSYLNDSQILSSFQGTITEQFASATDDSATLTGLTIDKNYLIFLAFQPTDLQNSACYIGTPINNVSLGEYYKEPDAVQKDPRCFIATAAYGTPFHAHLDLLRWFRDNYLLKFSMGKKLVDFYYEHSPAIARTIEKSPTLKALTRGFLFLPVIGIAALRWGSGNILASAMLLTSVIMLSMFLTVFFKKTIFPRKP